MQKIYKRTAMLKCDFNKVAKQLWTGCKSMDWFLYDNGLRHVRVNTKPNNTFILTVTRFFLCLQIYW